MKLIILRLNIVNKPSPMSEGVIKIQINSQPCKGINLTTRHTWATEATRAATVNDEAKKSGRVLPCTSVIFHTYALADTPWVAWTLSHCTPMKWDKASSNSSSHEATKFGDSICPICGSTFRCLFNRAQSMWALTDTGGGYPLGALNFISYHSSSFPYSILSFPLTTPPSLQLCQPFNHLAKPNRTSIDRKSPIMRGFQPLDFYRLPIQLSIAYYRCLSFIGVNKVV
jgi:hypothetical protein